MHLKALRSAQGAMNLPCLCLAKELRLIDQQHVDICEVRCAELGVCMKEALMARSNSPTLGHPKFPQAGPPDYDDSGATAMRAAASLRR